MIYAPGKSMIFHKKRKRKIIELVARPAGSNQVVAKDVELTLGNRGLELRSTSRKRVREHPHLVFTHRGSQKPLSSMNLALADYAS